MRQEPEKKKRRLLGLPETSRKITFPEDRLEKNLWNQQVGIITVHDTSGPSQRDSMIPTEGR